MSDFRYGFFLDKETAEGRIPRQQQEYNPLPPQHYPSQEELKPLQLEFPNVFDGIAMQRNIRSIRWIATQYDYINKPSDLLLEMYYRQVDFENERCST